MLVLFPVQSEALHPAPEGLAADSQLFGHLSSIIAVFPEVRDDERGFTLAHPLFDALLIRGCFPGNFPSALRTVDEG